MDTIILLMDSNEYPLGLVLDSHIIDEPALERHMRVDLGISGEICELPFDPDFLPVIDLADIQ